MPQKRKDTKSFLARATGSLRRGILITALSILDTDLTALHRPQGILFASYLLGFSIFALLTYVLMQDCTLGTEAGTLLRFEGKSDSEYTCPTLVNSAYDYFEGSGDDFKVEANIAITSTLRNMEGVVLIDLEPADSSTTSAKGLVKVEEVVGLRPIGGEGGGSNATEYELDLRLACVERIFSKNMVCNYSSYISLTRQRSYVSFSLETVDGDGDGAEQSNSNPSSFYAVTARIQHPSGSACSDELDGTCLSTVSNLEQLLTPAFINNALNFPVTSNIMLCSTETCPDLFTALSGAVAWMGIVMAMIVTSLIAIHGFIDRREWYRIKRRWLENLFPDGPVPFLRVIPEQITKKHSTFDFNANITIAGSSRSSNSSISSSISSSNSKTKSKNSNKSESKSGTEREGAKGLRVDGIALEGAGCLGPNDIASSEIDERQDLDDFLRQYINSSDNIADSDTPAAKKH